MARAVLSQVRSLLEEPWIAAAMPPKRKEEELRSIIKVRQERQSLQRAWLAAANAGDEAEMCALLEGAGGAKARNALADSCDRHGRSAVWLAAAAGELGPLTTAINAGSLIDQPDEHGVAALWAACA